MKRFIKRSVILMCCLLVSILIMPVSVNAAAKLNQKSITLNVGKTYILKSSGTRGKITWTSSNRSVASVTSRGIVKAVKKGTATITARYGKSKLTCKVTVKQPVTSIKLGQRRGVAGLGYSVLQETRCRGRAKPAHYRLQNDAFLA